MADYARNSTNKKQNQKKIPGNDRNVLENNLSYQTAFFSLYKTISPENPLILPLYGPLDYWLRHLCLLRREEMEKEALGWSAKGPMIPEGQLQIDNGSEN